MPSRLVGWAVLWAGAAVVAAPLARADEEMSPEARRTLKFVQGLREKGYHDLALDYLKSLRDAPDTPADLRATLDYHEGRGLLEEATITNDIERKAKLLDGARAQLDKFAREQPKHPLAPDALTQLARLYVERGHTTMLQARELKAAEAGPKLAAARASFAEARAAYDRALPILQAGHDRFPKFIPEGRPEHEQKARAEVDLMNARLQRSVVDYEDAQSWPAESKERNELLDKAGASFELVYKDFRTKLSGLSARMLQGKCYEEKGELGPAMGIYNELVAQPIQDAQFNDMRRKIGFYRIIVDGKRKEYALAVDEAAQWLKENPRSQVSIEGLGVQLELARNLLAMLPEMKDADREEATRKASGRLDEVVRYFSPYKAEALELRRKFRPKSALSDNQVAAMSYDEATAQADSAMSTHEWDRAIRLLKHAVRKADPARDPNKANKARYLLAYCYYSSSRFYDAAVLAEFLATRYPKFELSGRATEIGLAAYTLAYMNYTQIDRPSDLDRILKLARYTAETWPDTDYGDGARAQIGEVEMGRGYYADSAKAYEAVRPASPRRLDAQVKAGDARWRLALKLRADGNAAEAEAQEKAALELSRTALDARKAAGAAPTDPALIANTTALAEIHRGTGRPKEAIALLEPLEKALGSQALSAEAAPAYEFLITVLLKAHIADGQTDKAIADMKALEKSGSSPAKLTGFYHEVGQSLQRELVAQQAKKDSASYKTTREAFRKFLTTLAQSQSGQTFESLRFAGEAMIEQGMPAEALAVLDRALKAYEKDPEFLKAPGAADRLLLLKLRRSEALRKTRKFAEALAIDDDLLKANPRQVEALLERGFLLEDWAKADNAPGRWNASYDYWKDRAAQFERIRPRRIEYYDCVYHMAVALAGMDRKPDAVKTLKGVMTFSPSVGKPEMKAKYQALIAQLGHLTPNPTPCREEAPRCVADILRPPARSPWPCSRSRRRRGPLSPTRSS